MSDTLSTFEFFQKFPNEEVVRVALTNGLSRKQVASDCGIGFSTLSRWIKEERYGLTTMTAPTWG